MSKWDGIDEFVAVATHRSFNKAADALNLSRTHMSRALAGLEDRLQVRLLNRTTRTVNPTPTGEIFLDHCRRLVAERDEALALVGQTSQPGGQLGITCSVAIGERYIAPIARQMAQEYPRLQINLDLSNRVVDLVSDGFDVAIRTGQLAPSSLIATRVAERRLFTCATPAYLARAGTPATVAALAGHACLVGTASIWHFRTGNGEQLYRPRPHWRCNSGHAVAEAAMSGMGICQLPDFYVQDALRTGTLVAVLSEFSAPAEPIWAVYPGRRHLNPSVTRFIEIVRAELPRRLAAGGHQAQMSPMT
ncbi:MAG: LysR family transcriptional regulator [Sphingomonadales bacterium]|nr:LysR family transcriptional regulator [Sphingomonadales bacterium]